MRKGKLVRKHVRVIKGLAVWRERAIFHKAKEYDNPKQYVRNWAEMNVLDTEIIRRLKDNPNKYSQGNTGINFRSSINDSIGEKRKVYDEFKDRTKKKEYFL